NLYARERFPHHLTFVRNLLRAYSTIPTRDPVAYEALLRRHWFEDDNLAAEFYAVLSRTNRLDAEIAAVRSVNVAASASNWPQLAADNPVAARFVAEADVWRSHFESATPALTALAAAFPGDIELSERAGSLQRSLSYSE